MSATASVILSQTSFCSGRSKVFGPDHRLACNSTCSLSPGFILHRAGVKYVYANFFALRLAAVALIGKTFVRNRHRAQRNAVYSFRSRQKKLCPRSSLRCICSHRYTLGLVHKSRIRERWSSSCCADDRAAGVMIPARSRISQSRHHVAVTSISRECAFFCMPVSQASR